jgi:hypothetical protein
MSVQEKIFLVISLCEKGSRSNLKQCIDQQQKWLNDIKAPLSFVFVFVFNVILLLYLKGKWLK